MFQKISILTLLGILVMLPISVYGQGAYFGPHLGIQKSQDAEDANYLVGGTLRLKLLPVLAGEAGVAYRQEKFANDAVTVRQWPITITGLLYPLPFLYGGVGAGWYNTTYDYADMYNTLGYDDNTDQEFGWHLVAGVEVPTSSNVAFYGDVRYTFLDHKFRDLPNAVLDGDRADFYSINLGLLLGL